MKFGGITLGGRNIIVPTSSPVEINLWFSTKCFCFTPYFFSGIARLENKKKSRPYNERDR